MAVSIGVRVPREIVGGIVEAPTLEYWDYYHTGQDELDVIAEEGAKYIRALGFSAVAMTKSNIRYVGTLHAELPHKTVATRAGLGWIGKSGLLLTEQFGAAIWFSSILTDIPLITSEPINESKCGDCSVCKDACPAKAISGNLWNIRLKREDFFDVKKCVEISRERAKKLIDVDYPLCGRCIAVCPRTQVYLKSGN
jgi:epoxyqueuosine reductase QueG